MDVSATVDVSGRWLYVDYGTGGASVYTINSDTGTLTAAGTFGDVTGGMGDTGGGTGGAIAIYTRKGSDIQSKPGGLNSNTVAGYTPMREFFSPNYASFNKQNEQRDIRTTLYWNPMIITTAANRSVVLSFYNNDVTKAFRVVIEGMTKEGLLAHVEEIME